MYDNIICFLGIIKKRTYNNAKLTEIDSSVMPKGLCSNISVSVVEMIANNSHFFHPSLSINIKNTRYNIEKEKRVMKKLSKAIKKSTPNIMIKTSIIIATFNKNIN
jgi:hypothetical protein